MRFEKIEGADGIWGDDVELQEPRWPHNLGVQDPRRRERDRLAQVRHTTSSRTPEQNPPARP
jgi:hypothetical protein